MTPDRLKQMEDDVREDIEAQHAGAALGFGAGLPSLADLLKNQFVLAILPGALDAAVKFVEANDAAAIHAIRDMLPAALDDAAAELARHFAGLIQSAEAPPAPGV